MFALNTVKLDPARLAGGSWWRIWGENGRVLGEPTDEPDKHPSVLIVPKGLAFSMARSESEAPHRDKLRDKPPPELIHEIHGRALGLTVLRGMRNISFGEGQPPIEWTEEKSVELMTSPQWRSLFDFVDAAGESRAAALAKEEAAAQGN